MPSNTLHPSWLADDEAGSSGLRYRTPRYLGKTNKFKEALQGNADKKYTFDCELETAKEYARLLVDGIPSFNTHVQDFLDAEDESQGIEDAYHPKHDQVYCWRLRRLMSMQRLSAMESMSDGNIAKGLLKMGLLVAKAPSDPAPAAETIKPEVVAADEGAQETSEDQPQAEESEEAAESATKRARVE
jgi:hypothetical protein